MKNFIICILLMFSMKANAGLITVNISSDTVAVGSAISVEINGSNFVESDMFWFDFNFDNSIFSFDIANLTSELILVDSSLGLFDGLGITSESFGLGFLFSDMFAPVSGDFNIATFELVAETVGTSFFDISGLDGFATDFNITPSYIVNFSNGNTVSSEATSVPEPSTLFIALLALASFVMSASRKVK
ncbi:PEP-CTERM sorting domain-containing protein [Thalassotalea profundi]|uniref:Ice-binding protein C-terminal domain-containing protein n=1 Tax=Thalassotalea profundi TaxID=2036687 RepID=A0ABQ3IFN7_9GAMM|nr:PEP-CTERM sorting domain-containing protein [Thalassotalea profundi]GHE81846.1 hypothetical protein GCM10011501_07750 [Thalassotalea profundi]